MCGEKSLMICYAPLRFFPSSLLQMSLVSRIDVLFDFLRDQT